MTVSSAMIVGRPEWGERIEGRPMYMHTNGGVTADVEIVWHLRAPDDYAISIMFGTEQIMLDFYDVESLERLRDVANQAASRLRAAIKTKAYVS